MFGTAPLSCLCDRIEDIFFRSFSHIRSVPLVITDVLYNLPGLL